MPEKTGLDLLHITKKQYPNIKSVILSGYSDFEYTKEAIRCGAVDYLTKPVNLEEVGKLLDKLKAEFIDNEKAIEIQNNRIEAILLSIARGHSTIEPEKYQLPTLNDWYGVSMSVINKDQPKEGIKERINLIKRQISSIVPSAILLKKDIYTFFAIIPYKSKSEFDSFIVILEQILDSGNEWICGVSKSKNGIYDLPNGWNESSQALRYHSASAREGIIFYKNIETLFSSEYPEVEDLTNELIRKLNNPETRKDIIPWFPDALISITSNNISITEFQTLSIRCLIEINAFLQDLSMDSNKLRNKLNAVLGHILTSNSIQDTVNCVAAYLEWIIECLNQSDADKDGKCIIDEIQSFIRQHYNENITLNMLAEQFFLHPNYLSRLFKEKTGDNFVDYLTEIRIDKAKDLLKNTDNKIIEICYIVGYNNSRYFNKVFKQHTGMTPSKYRQTSSS